MKIEKKLQIIEDHIDKILDRVSIDVEEKIKTGEIMSIQNLYDAYYNKEILQQTRAIYE